SGGRRAGAAGTRDPAMGSRPAATPAIRRRTPATQPGQWGNQPPHRQTDARDVDVAPGARPSTLTPRHRLGDAACPLDKPTSISDGGELMRRAIGEANRSSA